MAVLADVQLADHPGHVATQRPHGLHALLVLGGLSWRLAIDHIPVLRADNGHVEDGEVLVQTVEGSRGSTSATDHHAGAWLEL